MTTMRVLWTHNFDPDVPNKGTFVNTTAEGIRARGIDLTVEYLGNLRSLRQIRRARAHVRELADQYDLIHAQFGSACAIASAAGGGVPRILTLRGSDWKPYSGSFGFLFFHTRIASSLTKHALDSYDCIVCVSRRVAAELGEISPNSQVEVIPSPVDLRRFVPCNRRDAKALLGHPNCTEKWVLFNALNLKNPIKRFELARKAFQIAQARHGNLRLRLATEMPHDLLPPFVAACDVILCTSESEGWPNSVKEALACNVPFVATDVSDLRDIASVEGSCRICPADPRAIADTICQVLEGPEPQDLRRFVRKMSLEPVCDHLISVYQTTIQKYHSSGGRCPESGRITNDRRGDLC